MKLSKQTKDALKHANSIHKPNGFTTSDEVRAFWKKNHGARGFLNIKEITPQMVHEIHLRIINSERAS